TRPVATNVNIRVETTSSTPSCVLSRAGTTENSPPATTAPAIATRVTTTTGPSTATANQAAVNPPSTKPASAPRLNTPARNEIAVATPVNNTGVEEVSVPARPSRVPNACVSISS